ncbi:MAG: HAD-IA family hydrolase [Pseudomonadota bacterium]
MEAIIFDCDGVLVNSESLILEVELSGLSQIGLVYERNAFIARFLGMGEPEFEAALEADCHDRFSRPLPPGFFESLYERRIAAVEKDVRAIAGAHAFASGLSLARAVASSSKTEALAMKLQRTGLAPLFGHHVYSADQVARAKPAPDLFLHAADALGADPSACLVIEDSANGVRAAAAAGMTCWGFTGGGHCPPGHGGALRDAGAAAVFECFEAVGEAFARIA